jgi:uncharacterized protein
MGRAHLPGRVGIDAYGDGGFRFGGMSHKGSILILPSGVHGWDVTTAARMSQADFADVLAEADGVDFLLLGTGPTRAAPPAACLAPLRDANIGVEIMDTGAAVRTFNILLDEGREVAAALIAVDG